MMNRKKYLRIGLNILITVVSERQRKSNFFINEKNVLKCKTSLNIETHKLPLSACSLSIASNKALKFPLPKLFAPFL